MMNRIKETRLKKGITQSELASYLGVAQNTLSYWEKGKFDIDNSSLCKISSYFHVSIDYLLGQENNTIDTEQALTLNEEQIIKKYRLLDAYGQKAVNHMLNIEYERCSGKEKEQDALFVARSGERDTIKKSKEEFDDTISKLKPDTSEQF